MLKYGTIIQSTLDISTTRYLELFDFSNFLPGSLDILQLLRLKCSRYTKPRYIELFIISNEFQKYFNFTLTLTFDVCMVLRETEIVGYDVGQKKAAI